MDPPLPSHWNNVVFQFRKSVVRLGGQGTGFLIGSLNGYSLLSTCEHVMEDFLDEERVDVQLLGEGSLTGYIIHEDSDNDTALVMVKPSHAPDPVISGVPLRFSDHPHADTVDMDVVMLGYFALDDDHIKEPGTSHGYSLGHHPEKPEIMLGTYTSRGGTSGSPVFLMEEGLSPLVIGMHSCGYPDSMDRGSVSVTALRSSLNKFLGSDCAGMTIHEMIDTILELGPELTS